MWALIDLFPSMTFTKLQYVKVLKRCNTTAVLLFGPVAMSFFTDNDYDTMAIALPDTVAALDEVIAISGDGAVLGAKAGGR